jgi:DNA-binding MarR family transcriptional regulator
MVPSCRNYVYDTGNGGKLYHAAISAWQECRVVRWYWEETMSAARLAGMARGKGEASDPAIETLEWELMLLVRALEAVQRKRRYPLERAHYLLLGLIEREGPQSIAGLATHLLLDGSTVTRQVATMEELRLVEREPHPQDGRSTLINATPHGRREAAKMRDIRLTRVAALLEGWTGKERATFAELLARLNVTFAATLSTPQR